MVINSPWVVVVFWSAAIAFSSSASSSSSPFVQGFSAPQPPRSITQINTMKDSVLEDLTSSATAYCSAHGIQVANKAKDDDNALAFTCAPISLLPNAYPKAAFAQAQLVAPNFNLLVDRVSRDPAFLQDTLGGSVRQADPFTAQLLDLYGKLYVEKATQSKHALAADRLGLLRSDYMLHATAASDDDGDDDDGSASTTTKLQQVELNTIASSFAGLSHQVAGMHTYLTQRHPGETQPFLHDAIQAVGGTTEEAGVPSNPNLECLPAALALAVHQFSVRHPTDAEHPEELGPPPAVLFVVQDGETNTVDQRMLEFRLWQDHQIPVVRQSLTSLAETAAVDDEGILTVQSSSSSSGDRQRIAVVYFRAGYAPTDYPDGDGGREWQARETLEASVATKCPNLGYHLAGTKKVQQQLARPGVLEQFFGQPTDDAEAVNRMRAAFAGLYSLGDDATETDLAVVHSILQDESQARQYVLKPQREGGGYNFYNETLRAKLQEHAAIQDDGSVKLDTAVLGEYILMERLFPPQQSAILLRNGRVEGVGDSISELGCFGTILTNADGSVVQNDYAGFLLRTKFAHVDEGGVASGFATLSSPYLC